jgi:CheY-like chemotaxis protein
MRDKKNYNILVVEDNPRDYFLFEEFIRKKIEKPKIKDIECFSQLQNMPENINEFDVVLTEYSSHSLATKTIELGANDYLFKDDLK